MKHHKTEKKLYEALGIELFRILVLKCESFKHRNDDSKNINYHLKGRDINSVQSFTGYLLYNAVCHVISLVFIVMYFTATSLVGDRQVVIDIPMCVLLVINVYCIILQRYTQIKTQAFLKKQINARKKRVADKIELLSRTIECREYYELQNESLLIDRIHESIQSGADCIIAEGDATVLQSISKSACEVLKTNYLDIQDNGDTKPLADHIVRIPKNPLVICKIEQRAAVLQDIFHIEKRRNVLFGFCIITENSDCEIAYRDLVPNGSRNAVEYAFDILIGAYNKALVSLRGTQESV